MPMTDEEIIDKFIEKMERRYPDCRVVNDVVSKEVIIVEDGLTFRHQYIISMYRSMNW